MVAYYFPKPALKMGKRFMLILAVLSISLVNFGQSVGDYQTTSSGNWNENTTWQVYNGTVFVDCGIGDYPGAAAGTGTVNILNNATVTLTADVPNSIGALSIDGGNADSYLQFNSGVSLVVSGQTYLNSNSANDEKSVLVDAGIFRTGSIDANSNGNNRDAYIRISTGSVIVDNNVTLNSTAVRTYIRFTGDGTLYVGGTISGGAITSQAGGGINPPTSGTVNYNSAGAQTVGTYTYYNLTLSGSGLKTTAGIAIDGMLSMEGSSTSSEAPTYGASATLRYMGSAAQITGPEFISPWTGTGGVLIENSNGVTLNEIKTIGGTSNLTIGEIIANSTFNDGGYQITCTGTLNLASGAFRLGAAGTATSWPAFSSVNITAGTAVEYAAGVAQTVSTTPAYRNLSFSGAGTKTIAAGILSIAENWSVTGGTAALNTNNSSATAGGNIAGTGAITSGNGTISVAGDFSNSGTFTCGTGTVNYNGVDQQVKGTTYYNLTLSNGGTKTLQAATTINRTLTLNTGILQIGDYDLYINYNVAAAITGAAFSSANMIATDGNGFLVKNGTSVQTLYPVGSGGYYSPSTLVITAGGTGGTISSRTVSTTSLGAEYIPKLWDIKTSVGGKTITATFGYNPLEVVTAPSVIWYKSPPGNWLAPNGTSSFGGNSFTITGTTNITTTSTYWTGTIPRTYYSYQTGDWNVFSTWTSDPSGTLQTGNTIPGSKDIIVILSGRTVTLSSNVTSTNNDITINEGGYLNMSTYSFTGGLHSLNGNGTLKLASASFPATVLNTFVATGGGTTEYIANINLPVSQTTYNNLKINTAGTVVQLNNLTLNGNLEVVQGKYQINDNSVARRQLTINGNVTVSNGAFISVGTGVTNTTTTPTGINTTLGAPFINYYDSHSHRIVIMGDFTNNGTVRFTNLTYPVYNTFPPTVNGPTTGFATVYFRGSTNNSLNCNGTTDFYNLVLDKGTDQTYSLTITSSDYNNFRLFGANIAGGDVTAPATASNPNLKKALWIRTGTLKLEGLVVIPSLSEGNDATAAALNYIIPVNAALNLNGIDVIVQTTADLYQEVNAAYGVSGGSGTVNGVIGGPIESGLLVLGKLEVNNGYLSSKESQGILYNSTFAGQIFINGGTVDAKQFRSLTAGTGLTAYTQTGGIFILRGRFQRIPSAYTSATDLSDASINTVRLNDAALLATAGSFSIENISDVFTMTGGSISIYDVPSPGATSRAYDILTSTANFNVTGGTVSLFPTTGTGGTADATPWLMSSAAPVGNLLVNRASSTSTVQLNTGYPLTVLNNLTLQSGVLTANNQDLTVGGNFIIASGTTYTTGTNTTVFNGSGTQTFTIDLASAQILNNLKIDKTTGVVLNLAGTQSALNITGTFSLYNGTFNDNGKNIYIAGDVYNSGLHSGTGKLSLNGISPQAIDGSGTGEFQNLELNNTNALSAPVSLSSDAIINGVLTFSQNKLFNISTHNLRLNSTASIVGAGTLRYIQTTGALGDGGLTKVYSSPASFSFPIGVVNYTPGSIGLSGAPTAYGSITIIPVNYAHPNVTTSGRSLSYFWRVKSSDFILGAATVTHGYIYNDANVVTGAGITENEYVAARYNPLTYTWTSGTSADVDETSNIIGEPGSGSFLENTTFIDGDYTAGDDSPINPFGTPVIYYSRQDGNWGTTATWSLTSHTVTNPPSTAPGANDIVIIGNGHTISFATPANYLTLPNTDPHSCASLQIEAGATLNIRFNPSSTFSMVQSHPNGNGTIRIACDYDNQSTFAFPSGDFSDFNQNLGTTELYSTNNTAGTTFWLPNGIGSYGNLIISPLGGSNIIFPNNDLTVLGDLIVRGQNADSWFLPTWNGNYPTAPTARVSKTITVMGDFDIQGGSFGWYGGGGGGAQDVVVNGDVIVAPGAGIDVWSSNTSQSMAIGGSLINNSTNATAPLGTLSYVRLTLVPVTFFGSTNASITNTAGTPRTDLGSVIINKGTSQSTTLTLNIGNILNTPTNNWLTLQNGTFIYARTNPLTDFTITTTNTFAIPATAGLYVNYSNSNNRNILIGNAANNNGDLLLSGKLTVISGNVYVGPTNAPANNNDIEYSGSGSSEIVMQGGTLVVNGQIRRAGTSGGVLNYSQSGTSDVTINGRAAIATNAKLEILNAGSSFNMAGTSILTIVRGGGSGIYGDLYLRPENSSVTGGTINLQPVTGITAAEETFKIDASVTLHNLTITGFAASDAARVSLNINPLVLAGNLTLTNTSSYLTTNNLDVTISGNFFNSGTYNYGTNTTRFSGNTQSILGSTVTNFNHLDISSITSLTVNNSFNVNGNLTIGNGTLVLSNYKLSLVGNITNNSTYSDDNITGGVSLAGSSLQQIYGTGSFGRLELNNSSGAKLNNDITVQNDLVLTIGKLDINAYMLTLGLNSIIGGSPFSLNKMIVSDGVSSSFGVRKFFNIIAAPTNFTFPVGVAGKFTPASFDINTNGSVGYISVNPINNYHPVVLDPSNVLNYYWEIESLGITNFDGSLTLKYLSSDVRGTESNYVAARLLVPGTSWSKATPGPLTDNVDETTHIISFSMPSGTNNLSGDFTAGSDSAIPDEVPVYSSITSGDWSDESIWLPVGSSPPCPIGGPNGFIVIIDHQIITDVNYCFAYKTTINNRLRIISTTYGHNLGLVNGTGTLEMESGNFPAGDFSYFLDCSSGGTLEYGGTGTYSIIASQYSSVPNLFFTGSGARILPNRDLTICDRLVIDGPTLDNTANNRTLIIKGTMERYNTGTFLAGTGSNATVSFQGTTAQSIGGATGNFNGTNHLNNLEINNPAGLDIGIGSIEIGGNLLLTNGIINTTPVNSLVIINTLTACVIPAGGSTNSFVNGPLTKRIPAGNSFIFPIGIGTKLGHTFTVTAGSGAMTYWTARYSSPNSTAGSYAAPLQSINTDEYWSLSSAAARNGYVKMAWDIYSALTPLMTENGLADMRVAEYSTGSWIEKLTSTTGNDNAGDVATTNTVSITSTEKDYTIASITPTIPRATLAPIGPVCGAAGIPVQFTSFTSIPFNYIVDYAINSVPQTPVTVTSVPYTLLTPVPGVYKLTGFKYNNGINTGVADITEVTVYATPTTSDAGTDQSLCGLTSTTLDGNDPTIFTGLWTIVSGSGGSILSPNQYNSSFIGIAGNTYTLRWTISNGSCTSEDEVLIAFPVVAAMPSNFTSAPTPVCQGTGGHVYTVPNVSGYTYNWSYSGTGHTITGSGNSVTIDFSSSATSGILGVTATNSCGTSSPRTISITVNPIPVATFSYSGTPYCPNAADPYPTFSGGGVPGTFSSTAGLVFVSTATGQVDISASTPGDYIVTNTITAAGGCSEVIATSPVSIISDLTWTGAVNTDWNTAGNWSCGFIPVATMNVQIPDVTNKPVLSGGAAAAVNNLVIDPGSSLTITGNSIQISGTISNNGTFTTDAGIVEMNGSVAQVIGADVFAGNTIMDLIINNPAGVTLQGPLNIAGIVKAQSGDLSSGGFLTLSSTAAQTALIDGSGTGQVNDNVTMQRYLPSGFGYKYFSSPFQAATVNDFADDITLGYYTFYRYDESRTTSGWVSYHTPTTNPLIPLEGYAVNFGAVTAPNTTDVTGIVNNGSLSVTLYNNNNTYTQGFNLVGNPYPSPIDWDAAAGWTKTNIDNALYYFKASTTDQYGGTYSTYINGVSSDGLATNIIPSMQGFFIHVTDGSFPVTGTLGMDNNVRITDLTHPFSKSKGPTTVPLLRLNASFSDDQASSDPVLIYFDEKATPEFDSQLDALKLFNTDFNVPNLYAVSPSGAKLSINALPPVPEDFSTVPLGLKLNRSGNILIKILDIEESLSGMRIYLSDNIAGTEQDLLPDKEFSISLEIGEYLNRFFLNLSNITTPVDDNPSGNDLLNIYTYRGILKAEIKTLQGEEGTLMIYNLTGQMIFIEKVYEAGYYEFSPGIKDGIYIVSFINGTRRISKKIFIQN
jgi:hypothetical protein